MWFEFVAAYPWDLAPQPIMAPQVAIATPLRMMETSCVPSSQAAAATIALSLLRTAND
jgi:hypothetical protein